MLGAGERSSWVNSSAPSHSAPHIAKRGVTDIFFHLSAAGTFEAAFFPRDGPAAARVAERIFFPPPVPLFFTFVFGIGQFRYPVSSPVHCLRPL